ncbi:hypothetical protein [Bacillus thuringiensis]|uniref:hypothetical protein n=1 Tax=Bacillus thuringiensis TaxID=1428 RepID=UPI000BFD1104|nr:hypothetical protein [Bacillus thuringiensis]PGM50831.1 hypothetical protein CN949_16200 [Bacillus thuringiensis]
MEQLNRGQLLDKAFKGEIKKGDKFKRVSTGCMMEFEGENFRWVKSRDVVQMSMNCGKSELFEKVEVKINVELTQEELNTLAMLMGRTSQSEREEKFERFRSITRNITSICDGSSAHSLYHKLNELAK